MFFFSLRSRNRRVYFASCVVRVISQENVKPSNKRSIIPLQKKILLFSHYLSISTWRVRIFRIPSVLKRSNRTLQGITAVLQVSYFERTLYPVGKWHNNGIIRSPISRPSKWARASGLAGWIVWNADRVFLKNTGYYALARKSHLLF